MSAKPTSVADRSKRYRARLLDMQRRMMGEVESLADKVREENTAGGNLSNAPVHMGDMASDILDTDIDVMESEHGLLEQINDALERIDNGTYGRCASCDTGIPEERLEAVPYAMYCVRCAEEQDGNRPRVMR